MNSEWDRQAPFEFSILQPNVPNLPIAKERLRSRLRENLVFLKRPMSRTLSYSVLTASPFQLLASQSFYRSLSQLSTSVHSIILLLSPESPGPKKDKNQTTEAPAGARSQACRRAPELIIPSTGAQGPFVCRAPYGINPQTSFGSACANAPTIHIHTSTSWHDSGSCLRWPFPPSVAHWTISRCDPILGGVGNEK